MPGLSVEAAAAEPGFVPVPSCWVCGGEERVPLHRAIFELSTYREQDPELAAYTGASVALVRCGECGFAQPEALPALPRFFPRLYDQRWSPEWVEREFDHGGKDVIMRRVLRRLDRLVPERPRALLDVGAHVGRLMSLAEEAGWTTEGVEPNPATAAFARRATGRPIHGGGLETMPDAGRFDAITMIDVLEHVPEPVAALARLRDSLRPGGWIAVKVPHGPRQLGKERLRARLVPGYRATVADNLVHVNHFSPHSLRLALSRAGFRDVRVRAAAPERTGAPARDALRRSVFLLARVTPVDRSPFVLHLEAYARR